MLTELGAAAIRERFALTELARIQAGTRVDDLTAEMLTVRLIVDFVESKVQALGAPAASPVDALQS
jgi:hypothetical protein